MNTLFLFIHFFVKTHTSSEVNVIWFTSTVCCVFTEICQGRSGGGDLRAADCWAISGVFTAAVTKRSSSR